MSAAWRKANPERARAAHRKESQRYRAAHPEMVRAKKSASLKKYWKEHPEEARAKARARRLANVEKYREYVRKSNAKNRVVKRVAGQKYYAANAETLRVIHRAWKKANPIAVRVMSNRRRALKAGNGGSHTAEQWMALCRLELWQCFYCATVLDVKTAVQEHKTPLSRGGSDDIDNIAISCSLCNWRKGTQTDREFMAQRAA